MPFYSIAPGCLLVQAANAAGFPATGAANTIYIAQDTNVLYRWSGSSYVIVSASPEEVIEGANLAGFPATGEAGKLYVAIDTGKAYRWTGSVYVEVSSAPVTSVAGKTGAVTLAVSDVQNAVSTSDARLSDERVPLAGSVTPGKLASGTFAFSAQQPVTAFSLRVFTGDIECTGAIVQQNVLGLVTQFRINTLGVVDTGTWQGSPVAVAYGGTGATTAAAARANLGIGAVAALTYAATITTDASAADIFDLTLTGNVTLANPTNPVNGKTIRWRIRQDATGNRAIALGNKFAVPSSASSPLPFSTAANAMDILAATYHSGRDRWDVIAMVPGY
jgi:hypothetical protein